MMKITKQLNVGVIGAGFLGEYHIISYLDSTAVKRVVVCDIDVKRLTELKEKHPEIAATYDSYEKMLASERLDAVSVVTPDHLHRRVVEDCLAECHVLVTKPMATNLSDAVALVSAADSSGRVLMVAHEARYRSRIRALLRLLREGKLGDVIHLRVDSISDKRRQISNSPWYASAAADRSVMVGTGVHEVDLLRYLIGTPIISVYAVGNRLGGLEFAKDKTVSTLFTFEQGAIGEHTVTYEARWPASGRIDDSFRLIATKGMVIGRSVCFEGAATWQELPCDPNEQLIGTSRCIDAFVSSVITGAPPEISGRDGLESLAACFAADHSLETGKPVLYADFKPSILLTNGDRLMLR